MNSATDALTKLFGATQRIVFLTGAGMSTESGIPDFRSPTGIYATLTSEDVFDLDAFLAQPERFYALAMRLLGGMRDAKPHAGHLAIAALAREFGKQVTVVTQNIDSLHQDAGSPVVLPVHGTWETSHCLRCNATAATRDLWPSVEAGRVPRHENCGGVFKPDIVFFGEMLPAAVLAEAGNALRAADLLVVAGTSLQVYPAAALPGLRRSACSLVVINQTPTPLDAQASLHFAGPVGEILGAAVAQLRAG